jgi:hypothetical protein
VVWFCLISTTSLPPVVVHVEVLAIADAHAGMVRRSDASTASGGAGFRLLRFRGQFLAAYGDHTVQILTNDRQHVLGQRSSP